MGHNFNTSDKNLFAVITEEISYIGAMKRFVRYGGDYGTAMNVSSNHPRKSNPDGSSSTTFVSPVDAITVLHI